MTTGDYTRSLETENARLKQAVEELSVLNEIVSAVGGNRTVDRINKLILQICIRHFGVEQGVVHLLDPTDPEEMLRTGVRVRKMGPDSEAGRYRLGLTLTGWMLKHQRPLVSDDVQADSRFSGTTIEIPNVRSVLAVPLRVQDRMLGILSLFNKLDGSPWSENDQRLLGIIGVQSAQVIENARLHEMDEDLRAARSIQQGLLPKRVPNIRGLDTFGAARPALEVGGDYYDWIELSDGRLGCVVADVSGKGMPAALLMAQLQAAFRAQVQSECSPGRVLSGVNELFGRTLDPDRFVTLFYAVIDPKARRLTYASAGHNPPLLYRFGGRADWLEEGYMPLGPVSRKTYEPYSVTFNPGDVLVVYTDGITEAASESGAHWDRDHLAECVASEAHESAAAVGEHILQCVDQHTHAHKQSDDITLAVVSFKD